MQLFTEYSERFSSGQVWFLRRWDFGLWSIILANVITLRERYCVYTCKENFRIKIRWMCNELKQTAKQSQLQLDTLFAHWTQHLWVMFILSLRENVQLQTANCKISHVHISSFMHSSMYHTNCQDLYFTYFCIINFFKNKIHFSHVGHFCAESIGNKALWCHFSLWNVGNYLYCQITVRSVIMNASWGDRVLICNSSSY